MATSSCQQNTKIVFNQKLCLAAGITLIVFDVGMLACAISEMLIGKLTASGLGFGMTFFNISCCVFSIIAARTPTVKTVRSLFTACAVNSIFCVLFFIGQILRIIYVVGYKSAGRSVQASNPEAAAAIWYTELAFLYVTSGCIFVLAAISGSSLQGGHKVAGQNENGKQVPTC